MAIGNNLARAFGLVGAMSIIRFRTAVKDTIDIVFIFFALAVGMAAGVGYHKIAIIGSLSVGAIILLLTYLNLPLTRHGDILLQFVTGDFPDASPPYLSVLQAHCRSHRVVNVRTIGESANLELSYSIRLKKAEGNVELVRALKKIAGVGHVTLYYDEEDI